MYMGKFVKRMLLVFLGVLLVNFSSVLAEDTQLKLSKNILVINSYHQGHKWESSVMEGFSNAAKENGVDNYNIKVEYFDFRNRSDEDFVNSFVEFIEKKYPKGSIDAIYTIDDEAFSVISPQIINSASELYEVPLFFSGIDSGIKLQEDLRKYITGILNRDVVLDSLNLILQLYDDINQINIITENSGFGDNLINKAKGIVDGYLENEITINVIQSNYIEDVEEQLKKQQIYSKDGKVKEVILIGGEFQYKNSGTFIEPEKTVELISEISPWPIFTNDPTYLNTDILGGCMDMGETFGETIFDMMNELFKGEELEEVKINFSPNPQWILKYDNIYKYNVDTQNIPRKCKIIGKKFYELLVPKYLKYVIGFSVGALLILMVIHSYYGFVTKRKIKEQEQEAKLRQDREKMQTDFVVNISHELRTPINIILSGISVIKLQLEKPSEDIDKGYIDKKFEIITQNSYRLLKLINNFIDLTKIESSSLIINKHNNNIVDLVETVFSETIDYACKKDITMIFDTGEEEIVISIDSEQIQRVVLNLLSNAIKFTPPGGNIYTIVKKEGKYVVIEVQDTGIGIPEERVESIFYRFYQVDNSLSRYNEGSGIGLSIVKELVELHGGKISVESEVKKGTSIKVYLPDIVDNEETKSGAPIYINTAVSVEMADVLK